MYKILRTQVVELAARKYSKFVYRDSTTTEEPIYVACNPELDGCCTQSETVQEARENLNLFRVDYIEHLLQHDISIPEPLEMKPCPEEFTLSEFQFMSKPISIRWLESSLGDVEEEEDNPVPSIEGVSIALGDIPCT